MGWFMIKNDFKRNKVINLTLLLFIIFSASLAVSSVLTAEQTITSISKLYDIAQPPHFVQMHKGEIDQKEIDEFMTGYEDVVYWQTNKMIDVYGESIKIVGKNDIYSLSDLRLDIGLVMQNEERDLLLNSEHEKVIIHEGEVGIPILLREMYGIEIGDQVILTSNDLNKEFVVKEFILDSMMNSTMTSSTRILLSDEDYHMLEGKVGEYEYLIETYFTDLNEASNFQTEYENAGLPQNGQAVTYTIIFILSALTDIVVVFVLLLVSILLIFTSFICIKYTIMAALEEEFAEIGTMKAIGLPFVEIRNLYLYKYRAITLVGVVLGYILALLINNVFTKHISATFGSMRLSVFTFIVYLVVSFFVYLLMDYYCKKVLKKLKKVTVVDALVIGDGFGKEKGLIKDGLHKHKKLAINYLMGIHEIFFKFRNWMIVFSVVLIAVLMILIPINLLNTFE
ncbi:MAG: ABC transporter permease, partial [Thermotaleaceae bacterium]